MFIITILESLSISAAFLMDHYHLVLISEGDMLSWLVVVYVFEVSRYLELEYW